MLDRLSHFFIDPDYHFLVATEARREEIVGMLIWRKASKESKVRKWEPKFPPGTKVQFFELWFGVMGQMKKQYGLDALSGRLEISNFFLLQCMHSFLFLLEQAHAGELLAL